MDNSLFLKGLFLAWSKMGLKDLKISGVTIYCSVPNSSYLLDAHGNEMSGKFLIKRLNRNMAEMGMGYFQFVCTIRNEHWTEEKSKQAGEKAIETINLLGELL